ncbi:MAG TPA: nickel pincer cofactor biosynthesis protein LarC [bacterium]|nr:nickel pincer cofactor biosynthesis protein LarC [bacterium]HPQ66544.1 nickel pincer cofactor biosynthesis protein LarC [bacterium]
MKVLKIEPFSGISGDMFVAAGAPLAGAEEEVRSLPAALGLPGVSAEFGSVRRAGITCRTFTVREAGSEGGDPGLSPPRHHHHHRGLSEIAALIEGSSLPEEAKELASAIFRNLGEAEAAVHGVEIESIHFHEVGGVDAILDITAAALIFTRLRVEAVYSGPVRTGYGFVDAAHGRLPVPAPATARLLEGIPSWPGEVPGEFTTPTGAAILRALSPRFRIPVLVPLRDSWGAGTMETPHPNAVRLTLAEESAAAAEDLVLVQANLDDLPPEFLGAGLLELLSAAGALDAWVAPVVMKKGRPGHKLEALCPASAAPAVGEEILEATTSLGVRYISVSRRFLEREAVKVSTRFGEVSAKAARTPSGKVRVIPEYEDCRRVARAAGVDPYTVYRAALGGEDA